MSWYRSEEGWSWHGDPTLVLGSSGPARVSTDDADPDHRPRPVGFTADLGIAKPAKEPLDDVVARVDRHVAFLQDRPQSPRDRCPECRDTDGHHFRCCSQGDT